MPRFTLKDVFLATTLIGIGLAGAVFTDKMLRAMPELRATPQWVALACGVLHYGFVALVGAGVGLPFQRKLQGAGALVLTYLFWLWVYAEWAYYVTTA